MFFLQSAGGGGKTWVCATIASAVRSHRGVALCVSSSGISALILPGSRTSHSQAVAHLTPNSKSPFLFTPTPSALLRGVATFTCYSNIHTSSSGMNLPCNTDMPLRLSTAPYKICLERTGHLGGSQFCLGEIFDRSYQSFPVDPESRSLMHLSKSRFFGTK